MLPTRHHSDPPPAGAQQGLRLWPGIALVLLLGTQWGPVGAQQSPAAVQTLTESLADPLEVTAIAEQRVVEPTPNGGTVVRYVPASQVRLGEQVHYTLQVRNVSPAAVDDAVVVRALPHNTRYVTGSAVGPGADVSFSIDGGATFAAAQRLTINTYVGPPRRATADEYTHIRWRLRHPLAPGATALLRFRAEFR
jgi:uncharacterized repeat protein (TIGR01451 family)